MAYKKSWVRGRKCVRRKRVRVKGQGYAMRCASYGPKRSGYRKGKKRGYRKGKAPFNKGKSCLDWGLNKRGKLTCRSYGAVYGDKKKNRRRSRPGVSTVHGGASRVMTNIERLRMAQPEFPAWIG